LEGLTKEKGVQIMLSRAVARHAGWEPSDALTMQVAVRGVAQPVEVIGVKRGRDLPPDVIANIYRQKERPMGWTMGLWRGA
jgi:class 3 adenylate cyclase